MFDNLDVNIIFFDPIYFPIHYFVVLLVVSYYLCLVEIQKLGFW